MNVHFAIGVHVKCYWFLVLLRNLLADYLHDLTSMVKKAHCGLTNRIHVTLKHCTIRCTHKAIVCFSYISECMVLFGALDFMARIVGLYDDFVAIFFSVAQVLLTVEWQVLNILPLN